MRSFFPRLMAIGGRDAGGGLDSLGFGLLVLLLVAAGGVAGVDVWRATAHGGVWTGTDGLYLEDQMQYLAWILDASRHVLVSNLFVLHGTPHDYLQPAVVISGGLVALGVVPWLALLLWQPVAIVALFGAVRSLVYTQLSSRFSRRAALVLAMLGGSWAMHPDLWLPSWMWGYPFALLSLAAMVGALIAYERASSPRAIWGTALLAGLVTWLQPWEGEVLVLVVVGAEAGLWASGSRPRVSVALLVIGTSLLPLAYFVALGRWDPSWRLGQQASAGSYPPGTLILTLAPLALPALLAYRRRPMSFLAAALRAWPPAALVVFVLAELGIGNSPMHGFLGISVPLALLAVEGVVASVGRGVGRSFRFRSLLAVAAMLALTVPVAVFELRHAWWLLRPRENVVTTGEWRALRYLSGDRAEGGVLTAWHLGQLVPATTARHTYIGNQYWSQPDAHRRSNLAWALFTGEMNAPAARRFVLSTHARFLLADCHARTARLKTELGLIIQAQRSFGCATLFRVL